MKEYKKPSVEVIKLAIEEVFLVGSDKDVISDTIPEE